MWIRMSCVFVVYTDSLSPVRLRSGGHFLQRDPPTIDCGPSSLGKVQKVTLGLFGPTSCGKSCFLQKLLLDKFPSSMGATTGGVFLSLVVLFLCLSSWGTV